ncbi:hypothetical protein QE152_g7444 [Popillia japonica]|uniref:Uncharacterized protein n=1 Tax=Popillia japonica TaxID=7064 RepID=A0AAW1MG00_POPJA
MELNQAEHNMALGYAVGYNLVNKQSGSSSSEDELSDVESDGEEYEESSRGVVPQKMSYRMWKATARNTKI